MADRRSSARAVLSLLAALAVAGACDQFPRTPEESPLGRSCQLNSDCNDGGSLGYYCTTEGYCDRDCKYDPEKPQLDCPGGCTCSVLGHCVTTEGTSCAGGQP